MKSETIASLKIAAHEDPAPHNTHSISEGFPDKRLFIVSLQKGLRIIEVFQDMTMALRLSEICAATGLGKSVVQRMVYTLHCLGYLRKDSGTKKYKLSSKVFLMGYGHTNASELVQQSYGPLLDINSRFGETSLLSIIEDREIVVLVSIPGKHIRSLNLRVGMRFPLDTTSSGLAILANMPAEEARRALTGIDGANSRVASTAKYNSLKKKFAEIRTVGYCLTENLIATGHLSISAPVFDAHNRAIAAINVSTLTETCSLHRAKSRLAPIIVAAAETVSQRLGYSN